MKLEFEWWWTTWRFGRLVVQGHITLYSIGPLRIIATRL